MAIKIKFWKQKILQIDYSRNVMGNLRKQLNNEKSSYRKVEDMLKVSFIY